MSDYLEKGLNSPFNKRRKMLIFAYQNMSPSTVIYGAGCSGDDKIEKL